MGRITPATNRNGSDKPGSGSLARGLRAAKEDLVRQHAMDAAEHVFAQHGFAQAKMQTIARKAGISLATLYQLYPGKQELYRAVLLAHDRELMTAVTSNPALKSAQPISIIPLLKVMHTQLEYLLKHPNYLRLILQEGYAWYHSAAQPTRDEQALWSQGLDVISTVFAQGVKWGELIPAKPADQARLLIALQQARLASWMSDGMQEEHEIVIARIQSDFIRQFCRPALAAQLLSEDGGGLSSKTLGELQAHAVY